MRVADYIFDFVAKQGVRCVFLVPGGGAMYLVDALGQNKEIEFVPNHHEQASAIAAEAYSRVNEKLGVALVTTGPGSTNAITAVAGAWIESVPLMIVSGQVKRADMVGDSGVRQMGPQEVDICSMVRPITKYAVTVMNAAEIRFHMEKALHLATTGRKGPVWIDVPLDIQASIVDADTLAGYEPEPDTLDRDALAVQVACVLKLIEGAKRPVIVAGHGIRLSGATERFRELVDTLGIPVVTTWNSMDLLPTAHPLCVGKPGVVAQRPPNFAVANSDLLIAIGARLDNVVTAFNPAKFGREAVKVVVDVDPHELGKFKMPIAEAVCCDASVFIEQLLAAAQSRERVDRSEWIAQCGEWKKRFPVGEGQPMPESGAISHYHATRLLSQEIPEDTLIVTGSSGLAVEVFYSAFENKPGQRVFLTSGLGAMGYGLPAMIGAGKANGGRPFVGIESDGSLQMNLQELLTIRALNLPVRIFILNNQGYASIRGTQRNYFASRFVGTGPEAKLFLPDIVEVAKSMGLPAVRVTDASQLRGTVRDVLAQRGPIICDIHLMPDEVLWPKSSAIPQPDGSMISMPLEDMTPLLPRDELRRNMIVALDPASEAVIMPPASPAPQPANPPSPAAPQEGKAAGDATKTYVVDIDGVIATLTPGNDYTLAGPIPETVAAVNRLYDAGHRIVLFTARGSATGLDWRAVTEGQMAEWGVKYHELRFGKPAADYYVDDRMISIGEFTSGLK